MKKTGLAFALLFGYLFVSAQNAQITIIDGSDGQPIPYANVCFESLDRVHKNFGVTNPEGKTTNLVTEPTEIAVSFVGFVTLIDTIYPQKNYTLKLKPSQVEVGEVVVTGQFTPQTVDKSIYSVQVINSMQVQNKAANNLSELLTNELNISTQQNGVLGSSIKMQGLSGEHIKILIDGVPVIGRQNGNVDLTQLNLNNIDHVEIIEGPMSVVYGSNALAGAINIITKENTRTKFSGGVNTYYETVGVYNADASVSKNFNNHHLGLSAGRNLFDGYSLNKASRVFSFDPKEQYFGDADYSYNTNLLKLRLSQDLFREKLINRGEPFDEQDPLIDTLFIPHAFDEFHYTLRANTKFDLRYNTSDHSGIDFLAAYSYYNKTKLTKLTDLYRQIESPLDDSTANDTTFFVTYLSRASYTGSWDKLEFQGGYDFNIEQGDGKRLTETKRIDDYAAFGSLKFSPSNTLTFQGGTRLIYNTKYKAPVIYSLNIKYDPTDDLNLRASFGKGFRSPSLKELYLDFVDVNHNVQGNPNLEAEFSNNVNFSADYKTSFDQHQVDYSLKLYYNQIRNKIDLLVDPTSATKANYINIDGNYKTIGTQLSVTYRFHPRFTFSTGINYYGNSKIADLNQFTYTPDFTASANYSNLKYKFKFNIYYKYNGKVSQYVKNASDETKIDENYIASYQMMDVTLGRPFFNDQLWITCGIKNLLNYKSIDQKGSLGGVHSGGGDGSQTIAWGRTFFIKLSYQFQKF